jgi:hypothetical protein
MLGARWNLLPEDLEDIEWLLAPLLLIVGSEELLMSLLLLVFRLAAAGVTATRGHVELWRRIDHHKVVLARVIVHIFLYVVVGLLNIIELLCFEIVVVYRRVVVVVILYLDVLSCLAWECLRWELARGVHFLFPVHLRRHVWGGRWRPKYLVIGDEKIVEIVLLLQFLLIVALTWSQLHLFIQEIEREEGCTVRFLHLVLVLGDCVLLSGFNIFLGHILVQDASGQLLHLAEGQALLRRAGARALKLAESALLIVLLCHFQNGLVLLNFLSQQRSSSALY